MRYLKYLLAGLLIVGTVGAIQAVEKGKIFGGIQAVEIGKISVGANVGYFSSGIEGPSGDKMAGLMFGGEGLLALSPDKSVGVTLLYWGASDETTIPVGYVPNVDMTVKLTLRAIPILGTVCYTYKVGDKLDVLGKVGLGFSMNKVTAEASIPEFTYLGYTIPAISAISEESETNLSYALGGGLKFSLSPQISLGAELGYLITGIEDGNGITFAANASYKF